MIVDLKPQQLGCCESCSKHKPHAGLSAAEDWSKYLWPPPLSNWINPTTAGVIAMAAIIAWLSYKVLYGKRGPKKRAALKQARADYDKRVASIRQEYSI